MEDKQRELGGEEKEEEHAKLEIWKYVFGFVEIAVVKCAIELGIADAIESHGSPMTLLELSSALRCDPSPLYRIMRSSPVMLAPWHGLSARIQGIIRNPVFEEVHGEDLWSFGAANPDHGKLFNEAMACDARVVVPAVIESCIEVFKGLDTIVDVGAGNGTALCLLVEACPWI
ncbi:unnamed protein product, partial [Prunus brigantina]